MYRSQLLSIQALAICSSLILGPATVPARASAEAVVPVTLTCNQQKRFAAPTQSSNTKDAIGVWMVGGVPGGNNQVGTISQDGVYNAPRLAPDSEIELEFSDPSSGNTRVVATVEVVEDSAAEEAHAQWLSGVSAAAAEHGCDPNLVLQSPTESVEDAVKIYLQVASEHTCLVLQPVSTNAGSMRYSFASGGEVDGVNIVYISDVSRMRMWNGAEIVPK